MYFIWDWKSNVPFIILYFWYNKQFITQMFSRYECFSPLENKLFPSLTNAPGKYHLFIVREINFHIALPSCNNTCSTLFFFIYIAKHAFLSIWASFVNNIMINTLCFEKIQQRTSVLITVQPPPSTALFTLDTDGSIRVFIGVDRVDPGLMLAILVDIRTVYGKFTYKE